MPNVPPLCLTIPFTLLWFILTCLASFPLNSRSMVMMCSPEVEFPQWLHVYFSVLFFFLPVFPGFTSSGVKFQNIGGVKSSRISLLPPLETDLGGDVLNLLIFFFFLKAYTQGHSNRNVRIGICHRNSESSILTRLGEKEGEKTGEVPFLVPTDWLSVEKGVNM